MKPDGVSFILPGRLQMLAPLQHGTKRPVRAHLRDGQPLFHALTRQGLVRWQEAWRRTGKEKLHARRVRIVKQELPKGTPMHHLVPQADGVEKSSVIQMNSRRELALLFQGE